VSEKQSPYLLPDGNVQISFSGGRTSAYMLHQILEANGDLPDGCQVVFANTGREMPQTLDFVQECAQRWSVNIVWVEWRDAVPGERFKIVSHNSAARNGEPFERLINIRPMLPNQSSRYCTKYLKLMPARDYLLSIGWAKKEWTAAIGIRADEAHRTQSGHSEPWRRWFPLFDAGITKHDVSSFWEAQAFDLGLPTINGKTWLGNCDGCFLKSEANIAAFTRDFPERAAWWERMESLKCGKTTTADAAQFRIGWSRKQLREFVESQSDWIFDMEDALCQADGGECTGD
jgi:3'-phosphoadenosine 5'-phosphosulfate sulfotransferase (PAPS reductase)/FAD synthetase